MNYLLDSNACITIINKMASLQFEAHLDDALEGAGELFVPSIGVHELWFGVAKSLRAPANGYNLEQFLKPPFRVLDFDRDDARVSGEIRAELARRGTPIGPFDTLIAGQALARGMTLVTANVREFSRVEGLKLEDWSQ
jgi:tRNA(fMet)-specific endonuclease VapC